MSTIRVDIVINNHGDSQEEIEITQDLIEQLLKDNGYDVVYVSCTEDVVDLDKSL